jgi:hypothetical protein
MRLGNLSKRRNSFGRGDSVLEFPMLKFIFISLLFSLVAQAKEIETNEATLFDAPDWLTRGRVEKVTARISTELEWTIRKITVHFYKDQDSFLQAQHLGNGVLAVTNKATNTVHIGPKVGSADFDSVFGHELVHVILAQKYKQAIPPWVEEGLANHLAKHGKVDYKWLSTQPFPDDVRRLSHPFTGIVSSPRYHYQASQALAEMIAKKCDMTNLLRLSVGEKMDTYIDTYCEIKDLNAEFKAWVKKKAG